MNLAIISSGYLPVPATKGGAVENLLENFIKENEKMGKLDITLFSIYDKTAIEISKNYKRLNLITIKPIMPIKIIDNIIYFIAKNILKKEKTMSYRYICQRLYYLNKVSKNLKQKNYDKILLENHATLFLALKWRKNYHKYKDRYYYHLHNEIKNNYGCEEIIRKTKNIICVSNYIINETKKHLGISDSVEGFSVLKNCINEDMFGKRMSKEKIEELKRKYNIQKNEIVLLFTGRLSKEKGIEELLLAVKKVKNENFKLLIVGSFFFDTNIKNEFEMNLKKIITDISNKIVFTGFIPYEEISNLYNIADIAVLPSIWEDPAPLTIIEAMKSGLPIITTYSGGIPEYANDKCAILIRKNDKKTMIEELRQAIESLLDSDMLRKQMSNQSIESSKDLTLENYYFNFLKKLECEEVNDSETTN